MHPGFYHWWQQRQAHCHGGEGAAAQSGCGARGRWAHESQGDAWQASGDAGFGVRRPLRFLANKLELGDEQVEKLATILSRLKTERAQGEVDQRRRITGLADAFERSALDSAEVERAETEAMKSEAAIRAAVQRALAEIHVLLDESQRKRFAYLLRTGVLSI
jgi:uncharacterized membrane protein